MSEEAYVDQEMEPDPELNRITNGIIGAAIEVHRALGAGLLESMYENAMAIEFRRRNISSARQVRVRVEYRGENIGDIRMDFIVAGRVVVESKAIETLAPVHKAKCCATSRSRGTSSAFSSISTFPS